jgi:hypothetical protein
MRQGDNADPSESGVDPKSMPTSANSYPLAVLSVFKHLIAWQGALVTPKPGGARRIAVGTAMALTDYPWSLARLAAAEIADGAR